MAAMRLLLLSAGLLGAVVVPAAAERPEKPFAPLAGVPDYVVTMVGRERNNEITRTIAHHGKWTRVDTIDGQIHSTGYFARGEPTEITITHRRADEATVGAFVRRAGQRPVRDYRAGNTGERQILLGESCTVWNVGGDRAGAEQSCVTDDGIELRSSKTGFIAEATRVERRPVAASEVEPPRELFTLSWWLDGATVATTEAATTDYEAVMRSVGRVRLDQVRTTRRHDPWTYVDETIRDQRHEVAPWHQLRVSSAMHQFMFSETDQGSRLDIIKSLRQLPSSSAVDEVLNEHDALFGERCDWFDTAPRVMDGGQHQCRTADGVVLKERNYGWGSSYWAIEAARLSRRPLTLDEVMPPAELLDPKFWGLD
jgi:hypothetical protein